jgi:hypothetical protein
VVQKRGRGWIYEVFTPPSVFVDRQTHALAAVPADEAAPAEPDARPPDLLLVEVRRGVFRFQLVGYAGERNDLCGIFTDMVTGGTVIGRAGEDIAPQEVLLKQLSLSQPATEKCGTGPTAEPVATATLLDETTGGEVALTTHGHALAGPPLGLFASRKTPDFHREMREGESIACNGVRYRVGRIELDPPLAVVECLTPDGSNVPGTIVLPCQSKNEKGAVHP